MERYRIEVKRNNEKVGMYYDAKNQRCMVGGYTRILKHVTSVAFDFMKMTDEKMIKQGVRQRNRFRYECTMTDREFRLGIKRLGYRYAVIPTNSVVKYT